VTGSEARVHRVLGDGPFREIGKPLVAALSPDGELLVVAGELDWPHWHGHSLSHTADPDPGKFPLAVYRTADLSCLHRTTTRHRGNVIAFHPDLPAVAVGTTGYDGGFLRLGELLLLDLHTGGTVSLLSESRQVQRIDWRRDGRTLDLILGVPTDSSAEIIGTGSVECTVRRDDWDHPTEAMLRLPYREWPAPDEPEPDPAVAVALVAELCLRHGRRWSVRRAVWAVEALPDGRILSTAEHVTAECWSPAGDSLWSVPSLGTGYQLAVGRDGHTALALAQPFPTRSGHRWTQLPSLVIAIDLDEGRERWVLAPGLPAVLTSRTDGWWALRNVGAFGSWGHGRVVFYDPRGSLRAEVLLGDYWVHTHYFAIRHAPDLLFLRGVPPGWHRGARRFSAALPPPPGRTDLRSSPERFKWEPEDEPWVVAADPDGTLRPLFPLAWDDRLLNGGCGAYLEDRRGPSLVHTGVRFEPGAGIRGDTVVVRRAYPSGVPQWTFTTEPRATALDVDPDAGLVYVAFTTGELIAFDAETGTVRGRWEIRAGGHLVLPLALARLGPGRLAIGTADGRVLLSDLR
jgi:hypothetical protein